MSAESDPPVTDVPFAQPSGYTHVIITESGWDRLADAELADFTVGEREVLCPACFLIHRPGVCDAD